MSAPYQSELCHALDPSYANGVPIRSANECQPQIEEEEESGDGVYESDVMKTFADAHLTEADISPPAAHSCGATVPCQWINEGTLEICGALISCKTVSPHFRDTHNIKGMESTGIQCVWKGYHKCIKRKNFPRHIKESHLGHPRSKKDSS